MTALSLGLLAFLGFLGAAWWFSRMKTEKAAKMVRYLLAGGAVTAGVLLSLRGAPVLGGPIGLMGLGILTQALRGSRPGAGGQEQRRTSSPGRVRMSLDEAFETLGLDRSANEDDVVAAHRRLMKKLHPDTGEGSPALARQVQEAKEIVMEFLRNR
ncbi:J domain-containing protein [Maricaulis sp.]|uniref:J domain-containing protein n=1 Tax=Maricaulis sp. TaxID=1486257 RepID=UPI001B2702D8|nr:J domain-containing protein [Maricaulis sp.]MBO6798122.1 J domain-containing protein [Maricaulis sp.]